MTLRLLTISEVERLGRDLTETADSLAFLPERARHAMRDLLTAERAAFMLSAGITDEPMTMPKPETAEGARLRSAAATRATNHAKAPAAPKEPT